MDIKQKLAEIAALLASVKRNAGNVCGNNGENISVSIQDISDRVDELRDSLTLKEDDDARWVCLKSWKKGN